MAAGLAILPILTSNLTFCTRRTEKSVDSFDTGNAVAGTTSLCVASGQLTNTFKFATNIAKQSTNALATDIMSADSAIKNWSKSSKIANGCGKILTFASENINPIICAGSVASIILADDKTDAAIDESCAIPLMFAGEALGKRTIGLPYTEKFDPKTMKEKKDGLYSIKNGNEKLIAKAKRYKFINDGEKVLIEREGWYAKNPFIKKQVEAITDFCETKHFVGKSLKWVPGVLKGLTFVGCSIGGYKLGQTIAKGVKEIVFEEKKPAA